VAFIVVRPPGKVVLMRVGESPPSLHGGTHEARGAESAICPQCGYAIYGLGLPGDCPECGLALSAGTVVLFIDRPPFRPWIAVVCALIIVQAVLAMSVAAAIGAAMWLGIIIGLSWLHAAYRRPFLFADEHGFVVVSRPGRFERRSWAAVRDIRCEPIGRERARQTGVLTLTFLGQDPAFDPLLRIRVRADEVELGEIVERLLTYPAIAREREKRAAISLLHDGAGAFQAHSCASSPTTAATPSTTRAKRS
jgi:hypothetical protein